MNILMIILRFIHIFAGVFWVGVSMFNIGFLQPAVAATGAEGQKVMQHLTRNTRLTAATYTASTLVVLSGVFMYGIISGGFQAGFFATGYGLTLGIGGVLGIVAWIIVMVVIRGIFTQMAAVGAAIQKQGGPPTPEQAATMRGLTGRLVQIGRTGLGLLLVTLLTMSIAQYVGF